MLGFLYFKCYWVQAEGDQQWNGKIQAFASFWTTSSIPASEEQQKRRLTQKYAETLIELRI